MDKKNILIIGGGGREHAIAASLKKSPKAGKLYCLPGNAGIAEIAGCAPVTAMDFDGILEFLNKNKDIGLTVVAPDDPLAAGLVDFLAGKGHRVFGPTAAAAKIEGSKAFAKELMLKYGIPTARYQAFEDYNSAAEYIKTAKYPLVVKADGLALGKGVVICENYGQASTAIKDMMVDGAFGVAGSKVVIEEFLIGKEVSILAFTDGTSVVPMVSSQDHKRVNDGDNGLNTGGMGAFSPSMAYTPAIAAEFEDKIMRRTIEAMNSEGRKFKGVIYFGLMLTEEGVKVLEYNARFGDPETQVVLPRLKTDLVDIIEAIIDERLADIKIEWDARAAVCVVLASGGYPLKFTKGYPITFGDIKDACIYHAGTKRDGENIVTSGGRVLGVTALGDTVEEAGKKAYKAVKEIKFYNMHYRTDIGKNL